MPSLSPSAELFDTLLPLAIAVPLLVAALMVTVASLLSRLVRDAVVLATTLFSAAVFALLLAHTADGSSLTVWLADWTPRGRAVPGIALYADAPAAIVLLAVGLVFVGVTIYAWRYFKVLEEYFHVMLLVLLAALTSLVLSADIFTMLVSFELMSVIAYALVAYKIEDEDALAGAFNFAVLGTVSSLLMMTGIAFLYAWTGTLNLAAMGRTLQGSADPLASVGLAMVMGGLLLKLAAAPLHFWIADAEAVAPVPVAALSSAAMTLAAAFWIARLGFVVAAGMAPAVDEAFRDIFLVLGLVSIWVGAVMCVFQTNLKRLLAFSTVSHVNVALIGLFVGGEAALAGTGLYLLAQSLVKAALFLLVGAIFHRFETIDVAELGERAEGGSRWLAVPLLLGGLALAGMPPFGLWAGKVVLEEALPHGIAGSVIHVSLLASAVLTGGAIVNAALHGFFRLGPKPIGPAILVFDRARERLGADEGEETSGEETVAQSPESREHRRGEEGGTQSEDAQGEERKETDDEDSPDHLPLTLGAAPLGLLALAGLVAFWPDAIGVAHRIAAILMDGPAFQKAVLDGANVPEPFHAHPLPPVGQSFAIALACLLVPLAWCASAKVRLPRALGMPVSVLRGVHDGLLNDYLLWLVAGFTGLMAAVLLLG